MSWLNIKVILDECHTSYLIKKKKNLQCFILNLIPYRTCICPHNPLIPWMNSCPRHYFWASAAAVDSGVTWLTGSTEFSGETTVWDNESCICIFLWTHSPWNLTLLPLTPTPCLTVSTQQRERCKPKSKFCVIFILIQLAVPCKDMTTLSSCLHSWGHCSCLNHFQ